MYGSTSLAAVLGAKPVDSTADTMVTYARSLAKLGLPVLLIAPGSKIPLDMRTKREKDKDLAAGITGAGVHLATTDTRRLKSYITRALADPDKKRAKTTPAPVESINLAICLRGSGYVVADADTPEEVSALQDYLATSLGIDEAAVTAPTVSTPGSRSKAHHGGGHWWLKLPEDTVLDYDALPSVVKIDAPHRDSSFSLYVGDAYVLIPPSKRIEGDYFLVAPDTPAPASIVDMLAATGERARALIEEKKQKLEQRAAAREAGNVDDFDLQVSRWNEATPWNEILAPAGWIDTGMHDGCGCPIFTAPGAHSSPKSATAHTSLCALATTDSDNPPLHLWSDSPGVELEKHVRERGSKTVSKLTVYALLHHGGDIGAACRAAGFTLSPTGEPLEITGLDTPTGPLDEPSALSTPTPVNDEPSALDIPNGTPAPVDDVQDRPLIEVNEDGELTTNEDLTIDEVKEIRAIAGDTDWTPPSSWVHPDKLTGLNPDGKKITSIFGIPKDKFNDEVIANMPPMGWLSEWEDMPKPSYIIDNFLEARGLLAVIGDSSVGKTGVVMDMICHIASGQRWHGNKVEKRPVFYIAAEGTSGVVSRLKAWRAATGIDVSDSIAVVGGNIPANAGVSRWAMVALQAVSMKVGLIVIDTYARMSEGVEENAASDTGHVVGLLNRLQVATGAAVMVIHHTAKGSDTARGSSALRGALDSEITVTTKRDGSKTWAKNDMGQFVDDAGELLPGEPIAIKVTKQKNGRDDGYQELCKTDYEGALLMTELGGNVLTPKMAHGMVSSVAKPEPVHVLADRIVTYLDSIRSDELMPGLQLISTAIPRDFARRDLPAGPWKVAINEALDYGVANGKIFTNKGGTKFSARNVFDMP